MVILRLLGLMRKTSEPIVQPEVLKFIENQRLRAGADTRSTEGLYVHKNSKQHLGSRIRPDGFPDSGWLHSHDEIRPVTGTWAPPEADH